MLSDDAKGAEDGIHVYNLFDAQETSSNRQKHMSFGCKDVGRENMQSSSCCLDRFFKDHQTPNKIEIKIFKRS